MTNGNNFFRWNNEKETNQRLRMYKQKGVWYELENIHDVIGDFTKIR